MTVKPHFIPRQTTSERVMPPLSQFCDLYHPLSVCKQLYSGTNHQSRLKLNNQIPEVSFIVGHILPIGICSFVFFIQFILLSSVWTKLINQWLPLEIFEVHNNTGVHPEMTDVIHMLFRDLQEWYA